MNLKYNYYYFKSVISPEDCQKIIDLGLKNMSVLESKGENIYGKTGGSYEKQSMPNALPQNEMTLEEIREKNLDRPYIRDSKISWIQDQWVYDLLFPYIHTANRQAGWNWQFDLSENLQFSVYENNHFYGWHSDGSSDHFAAYKRYIYGVTEQSFNKDRLPEGYVTEPKFVGKVRKISMTLNLNVPDTYEGGNLKFDFGPHYDGNRLHECTEIRPQGSIIVFPSFIPHCVTPVTSGKRYSLVMWVLGEPFK